MEIIPPPRAPPASLRSPLASPPAEPAVAPPLRYETRNEWPFSPAVLWIAGGATLASTIVPIGYHANALSIRDDYVSANDRADPSAADLASDYDSARGAAYATLAVPIVVAAATAGLAAWYVFGTKERSVPVAVSPCGVVGSFGWGNAPRRRRERA